MVRVRVLYGVMESWRLHRRKHFDMREARPQAFVAGPGLEELKQQRLARDQVDATKTPNA